MQLKEAILGIALRFQAASAANVQRCDTAFEERGADHQKTVAFQRVFFGTHQRHGLKAGQSNCTIEAVGKIRRTPPRAVVDSPIFVIDARIRRPATQCFAEEFVLNFDRGKSRREWLSIELREAKASGAATDVAEDFHAVLPEGTEKIRKIEIGVPDGEDGVRSRDTFIHGKLSEG
jgi:hypothetical protein